MATITITVANDDGTWTRTREVTVPDANLDRFIAFGQSLDPDGAALTKGEGFRRWTRWMLQMSRDFVRQRERQLNDVPDIEGI